jgi:hypothetical protein
LQVLATEELGSQTAIKLKMQTDQLVNVHKNVDLIESDLQRADKIVPRLSPLLRNAVRFRTLLFFRCAHSCVAWLRTSSFFASSSS